MALGSKNMQNAHIKTYTENGESVEDKYILNDNNLYAHYQMRVFDWEKYLNSFSSLPKSSIGDKHYSSPIDFEIICKVRSNSNEPYKRYHQCSYALEKGIELRFELIQHSSFPIGNIKWKVVNYGTEAAQSESDLEFFMKDYEGKFYCEQQTAYTGLHFMECYIYDSNEKLISKDRFGLFINDENRDFRRLSISEK